MSVSGGSLANNHSSRANFEGDKRNIMMAILTQVKVLPSFLSAAGWKRVSKQMASSTTTYLFESSSHQIISGLRSVQGKWLGIEYLCDVRSTIMLCDTFKWTVMKEAISLRSSSCL